MDALGIAVDEWPKLVDVELSGIAACVAAADHLLLFLDFDGTLAPIVPDPENARLPEQTRKALIALSASAGVTLAFISGRRLADLRQRVGIANAIYAGNHGLEIEGRGLAFVHPESDCVRPLIQELERELRSRLSGIPGALVENKGLTLSVHYRRVPADEVAAMAPIVQGISAGRADLLEMAQGRKIFEFLPRVNWNKGAAASWIRERGGDAGALAIYIGDDQSDEDAFRALSDGITIHAGESRDTAARYRLRGPDAVREFLEWLAGARKKGARTE